MSSSKAALFEGDDLWDPTWQESNGEATLKNRMTPEKNPSFTLYSSWFCPFAQRAWIAAEESGVDYQWVEINPYHVDSSKPGGYTKSAKTLEEKRQDYPAFMEASPRGLVPALQATNQTSKSSSTNDQDEENSTIVLWESLPVAEYIDAVYGGGHLINREDPYSVARQQIWCAHCTDRIQKKFYQALVAQDKKTEQECVDQFYDECRALANAMVQVDGESNEDSESSRSYFDGSTFSMVDIALAPFWQRIISVGSTFFGLTLPMDEPEFQRLDAWWNAVSTRPSVAATIVSTPRLVSSYSDYSENIATSDAAKNYIK